MMSTVDIVCLLPSLTSLSVFESVTVIQYKWNGSTYSIIRADYIRNYTFLASNIKFCNKFGKIYGFCSKTFNTTTLAHSMWYLVISAHNKHLKRFLVSKLN